MVKNRVREIRKNRGMTVSELAEAAELSHTHVSRIENGHRGLSIPIAERIARAMNVSVGELIGVDGRKGGGEATRGLQEDAAPYEGGSAALPVQPKRGQNIDPWTVKTNVLDRAGITANSVVFVDISADAVENLEPLQCVVAQVYDPEHLTRAVTILRQFVPPSLLITNSSGENLPTLDLDKGEAYVKGVVKGRFQPF